MTLSRRLTLVFSMFGLALAGGFQYNHVRVTKRETHALFQRLAETTASAIRALVEQQARTGSLGRLGRQLEEVRRQSGIATIVVKDRKGRRLLGRSDGSRWMSREPHPGLPLERITDGIYDVERPVDLGVRGKGVVELGFHTLPLEARLSEISIMAVRAGVMAFLAIALSAWLIGTWFGLRIERLVPRIEALPKDPEGFRPIRGSGADDEVSRLAAAFNRLGASLKSETLRRRALEREKQELSAMLVHDLKTPLTVIRSGIALLQEQVGHSEPNGHKEGSGPGEAKAHKRTFELLEMSTQRLHRMVDDVLQLSRLEEVAGLRERVSVDLAAMLQACAKDFGLVSSERGQKMVLRLPRRAAPRAMGDPALLRRVIDNLVHNAVEHTPKGGTITIEIVPQGAQVRVSVSDSGPGVPPEARADIFRKFFQKDLKRHVGNVGLGLALCEKVIHRHEGTIGIEDAKPHGACFYFTLPSSQPELL